MSTPRASMGPGQAWGDSVAEPGPGPRDLVGLVEQVIERLTPWVWPPCLVVSVAAGSSVAGGCGAALGLAAGIALVLGVLLIATRKARAELRGTEGAQGPTARAPGDA